MGNHLGTWVAEGQWGWTRSQEMDEFANAWWFPCVPPPLVPLPIQNAERTGGTSGHVNG